MVKKSPKNPPDFSIKNNKPEDNIITSIANPNLEDSIKELFEIGIDEVINNEIVKKIPILSLLSAGYQTMISYRDYLFMKKVAKFLYEQTKIEKQEREKWFKTYAKNEDHKHVGETLIELMDKFTSVKKAEILGILFRYKIKDELSTEEFVRIGEMINSVYLDVLFYFLQTEEKDLDEIGEKVDHLLSIGYLFRGGKTMGAAEYFPNKKPEHSDYGKIIYKILKKELNF